MPEMVETVNMEDVLGDVVRTVFKDSLTVKEGYIQNPENAALVVKAATTIVESFENGGKVMFCGNGGSAADSQHIAAEFINRFEMERLPLPAMALTTDSSNLTSIGNDYSFNLVFSKQVRGLGKEGDVLIAITTSGNSKNVIAAAEAASEMGIKVIGLTGNAGGELKDKVDILLNVDSKATPRVQETHITICHAICGLVDNILFKNV